VCQQPEQPSLPFEKPAETLRDGECEVPMRDLEKDSLSEELGKESRALGLA
jgi:hypothetical protein